MTKRRRVADWPTYLLKNIDDSGRKWLSLSAAAQDISISDVVRALLCERYRLDCPPESYRFDVARDLRAATILLRLQPKLAKALEREAERTGRSKRGIILETIKKGTLA